MFSRDSAGIIVKVEIGSVQVLDTKNVVTSVRLQDIGRGRSNKYAVALDSHQNQLTAGDIVKIQKGSHSGATATILHVYRSFLFVRSREIANNGGITVVRGRACQLVGGHRRGNEHSRAMNTSTGKANNLPAVPTFSARYRRRPQGHPLLNETVVIKTGPYKGLLGIVKDADERDVRVELHAQAKTVTVPTTNVVKRGGSSEASAMGAGAYGAQTPLIGAQTPVWGDSARTPMHQPRTPLHQPHTPLHQPHTPSHDASWNANTPLTSVHTPGSAMTPGGSITTPLDGPDTPSSWRPMATPHSATPHSASAYEPSTPMDPHTPNPHTPNPHTPMPHTPHTPVTPYGNIFTPSAADSPYTPAPMTPSTPNPATPTPMTPYDYQPQSPALAPAMSRGVIH